MLAGILFDTFFTILKWIVIVGLAMLVVGYALKGLGFLFGF